LWQAREARSEAARAELVKDFALSIFEQADTDAGANSVTTAADLLVAAQARVEKELAGSPLVATELMTAIGYALLGQGKVPEAGDILAKAVALSNRELGPRHPRTLAANVVYGEALVGLGRTKEAIALLTPAIAEARRQGAAHDLVSALRWLSSAQVDARDSDAAVAAAQEAVAVVDSPLGGKLRKLDAAYAVESLANVLISTNRPGQLDTARRALELMKEGQGDRLIAPIILCRLLVALALTREGPPAEAIDELTTLVVDARRVLGPRHPNVEYAMRILATTRLDAGDASGAVEALRALLAVNEQSSHGGANGLAMSHYHLATALAAARQHEEALQHFAAAAGFFREAGGPDDRMALRSLSLHALVQSRLGRLDAAAREFEALARAPHAGPEKAMHALRFAQLRSLQGEHDEAIALARAGADIVRVAQGATNEALATADSALGTILLAGGRAQEAIEPLQHAVQIYAKKQIMQSPDQADALAALDRARAQATAQ
jgi:tetratricopeptide (TPR) repeat protein